MPRTSTLLALLGTALVGCTRPAPVVPHDRLIGAVRGDSIATVLTLLDQGEDPNRPGGDGALPLVEAARLGRDSIAAELIRSGAALADTDATGHSAFDWAMANGDSTIADRLIRAAVIGAGGGPRVMRWFDAVTTPTAAAPDWRDMLSGELLSLGLMAAAMHDRADLIRSMPGARELPNRTGSNAMAVAARWGRAAAVGALLAIGTHPDLLSAGRWRASPLMEAARGGHVAIGRRLLRAGARVNRRDRLGETALHWAARGGEESFVRMLLAAGADPTVPSLADSTAAQVAVAAGHDNIAALLGEGGAQ